DSVAKAFRFLLGATGNEPLPGLRRPKFGTVLEKLLGQAQQSLRALAIFSIHERQSAVMRFGNLAAQWQPDPGTFLFRGKKRNEEISWIHDARTFVFNDDLHAISFLAPANRDVSAHFQRGINSVVQQID